MRLKSSLCCSCSWLRSYSSVAIVFYSFENSRPNASGRENLEKREKKLATEEYCPLGLGTLGTSKFKSGFWESQDEVNKEASRDFRPCGYEDNQIGRSSLQG